MSISVSWFVLPFPLHPHVPSLHLCLYSCPGNRFICAIFLDSTYMGWYAIFGFLFLTYFTLYDNLSTCLSINIEILKEILKWSEVVQLCPMLRPRGLWPTRLLRPWDSPGKNTGVGCQLLLQEIFPTQGIEPRSPALQAVALTSEPPGKHRLIQNTSLLFSLAVSLLTCTNLIWSSLGHSDGI